MRTRAALAASAFALQIALATARPARAQPVEPASVAETERRALEDAGLRVDASARRIYWPDGRELERAQLEGLRAPYDWAAEPLDAAARGLFVLEGCRFVDPPPRVLCLPDKKPASRLELMRRKLVPLARRNALERVIVALAGHDPSKPPPAEVRGMIRQIDAADPGVLPPLVAHAAEVTSAGVLAADAQAAYLESTRFFDARTTAAERRANAVALAPGWTPPPPQPFFDEDERRAGQALAATARTALERNPVGRELIAALGGALPPFAVLPVGAGVAAVFHEGRIVLSQELALDRLAEGLPRAQALRLKAELSKPGALHRKLAADPAARERLVARLDGTIVHELTHAMQSRRDRWIGERARGNLMSGDYAEEEHEAFLTQLRYVHAKLLADQTATISDDELESYESLVADFDAWREGVTQLYAESVPHAAATLPQAREVARLRRRAAAQTAGPTLASVYDQALKLLGLAHGEAALDAHEAAHNARMRAFAANEYPKLRGEAPRALARAWAARAARVTDRLSREHALETALIYAEKAGDRELAARLRRQLPGGGGK